MSLEAMGIDGLPVYLQENRGFAVVEVGAPDQQLRAESEGGDHWSGLGRHGEGYHLRG